MAPAPQGAGVFLFCIRCSSLQQKHKFKPKAQAAHLLYNYG